MYFFQSYETFCCHHCLILCNCNCSCIKQHINCGGLFFMKKTISFIVLAFCVISLVTAHGGERREPVNPGSGPVRGYNKSGRLPALNKEAATVNGNLTIARGMIAVNSSDTVYYVLGINRFVGF